MDFAGSHYALIISTRQYALSIFCWERKIRAPVIFGVKNMLVIVRVNLRVRR